MIFKRFFTVRFRHSGLKSSIGTSHIRVGLVALSSLTIILSHILQFQLVYRLWTLVIGRFMSALQNLTPTCNCRHWRRSVDELAATLHLFHHSCRNLSDFNLRLVKDNYAAVCTVLSMFMLLYPLM